MRHQSFLSIAAWCLTHCVSGANGPGPTESTILVTPLPSDESSDGYGEPETQEDPPSDLVPPSTVPEGKQPEDQKNTVPDAPIEDTPEDTPPPDNPTPMIVPVTPTPSSGCDGVSAATGLSIALSIKTSLGETRNYDLFVPPEYDGKVPHSLVFGWHGANGTSVSARSSLKLEHGVDPATIFVYPQGVSRVNYPQSSTVIGWEKVGDEDLVLFDDLIESIAENYCINRARIFSAGFSMGAYFTNRLACKRAEKLAAIAADAGDGPYAADQPDCAGTVPALFIVGDKDFIMNKHLSESVEHQRVQNVCEIDTVSYDNIAECEQFKGCEQDVVSCVVPGLVHQVWSNAGNVIANFFAHHEKTLPQP